MDDAGGLRGGGALLDRPRARLLGAGGEVGLQAEGGEADPGQDLQARLGDAGLGEELRCLLVVELD